MTTDTVTMAVTVFTCGALVEVACVWWTHFSERGKAFETALFSMLCAGAQVTGIFDSIKDWRVAPFFVIGYGFGTYIAVIWKNETMRSNK